MTPPSGRWDGGGPPYDAVRPYRFWGPVFVIIGLLQLIAGIAGSVRGAFAAGAVFFATGLLLIAAVYLVFGRRR